MFMETNNVVLQNQTQVFNPRSQTPRLCENSRPENRNAPGSRITRFNFRRGCFDGRFCLVLKPGLSFHTVSPFGNAIAGETPFRVEGVSAGGERAPSGPGHHARPAPSSLHPAEHRSESGIRLSVAAAFGGGPIHPAPPSIAPLKRSRTHSRLVIP